MLLFSAFIPYNSHSSNVNTNGYQNINNVKWQIESIVIKKGTYNPDETVQDNQVSLIDSGSVLRGIITLNDNKTILITENDPLFYFNYYEKYQWELLDNNFIKFKRIDNNGKVIQSFGFNVRFISYNKMQWFSTGTGIENGMKSVRIITFFHK